ncbi:hypothetical protein D3C80_2168580 [compost metagenome]
MEKFPAIALAVGKHLIHQLPGAQTLLQGIDQIADVFALGIDFLLKHVRVFLRVLFE